MDKGVRSCGKEEISRRIVKNGVKVLYAGSFFHGSTSFYRANALRQIGYDVYFFDKDSYFPYRSRGLHNLWRRLEWGPSVWPLNAAMLREVARMAPAIVFVEKGLMFRAETMHALKTRGIKIIHWFGDDFLNPINNSQMFFEGIGLYDAHITTKSYNVAELVARGARNVTFIDNSFEPSVFYPRSILPGDRKRLGAAVGFIGEYERERAESLLFLASHGIKVRVWGEGWLGHKRLRNENILLDGRGLWGEDYPVAICSIGINLCFLRKTNRDLQTTRSLEIPACGAFMLAERTSEHTRLFKEGQEAEFFSSNQELLAKVTQYLDDAVMREKIAKAGYERCATSGYSFRERFELLFRDIFRSAGKTGKSHD